MSQALPSAALPLRDQCASASPRKALDIRHFPHRARLALRLLERLDGGGLSVVFPDGQHASFGSVEGLQADLILHDWRVFEAALKSGDIGFAASWIDGSWTSSNLSALLGLLIANRQTLEAFVYGSLWGRLFYHLRHLFRRNSRAGSRRNIHAHYDIGNAFYRLWLDPSMSYSSALFGDAAGTDESRDGERLQQAQQAKYQRMLDSLQLQPGAHLLEIGCGWGGFAEIALRAGFNLTGLTLSTEQLAWARERCAALPANGTTADLRLQDYRDCQGQFDGIVSIEMFEAVGESYWPRYFDTLRQRLKPGGRACIQTIVIDDALFARYRQGSDFIQQYIFPGGMLPSRAVFRQQAERAGLKVVDSLAFGLDYARTLKVWQQRFEAELPAIRALGLDDTFIRTWRFYLSYCEAAFRQGSTDVLQFTLEQAAPAPGA